MKVESIAECYLNVSRMPIWQISPNGMTVQLFGVSLRLFNTVTVKGSLIWVITIFNTAKPLLNGHSQEDHKLVFKTN